MADTVPLEWPNQGPKILIITWSLTATSTIFVIWRVVYGLMKSKRFMLSDFLLIIATVLNITSISTDHVLVSLGLGRHLMDPTVLPNLMHYLFYLWITQITNIMAVAFLKWSICAWLILLNFSKVYQIIVWLSILLITAFGFLAPILTLFGCTPLEANWNIFYKPRTCWAHGSLKLSYTQGISNIITDVVYMAAPLIYLSKVKLSKRTQLGIRLVFLLSIPATICSIFKLSELKALTKTTDLTWDSVNLTIWSSAEASTGILIASLPPLRKAFDHFLRCILPTTLQFSHSKPQYGYNYGPSSGGNIRMCNFRNDESYHSRLPRESISNDDSDSDRAMLQEEEGKSAGIMKTTKVTVEEEVGAPSQILQLSHNGSHDWPEPSTSQSAQK